MTCRLNWLGLAASALLLIGSGCSHDRTGVSPFPRPGNDGGARADGSSGGGDGSAGGDGGGGTSDGGGAVDAGGSGTDAGSGAQGTCDPTCLEMSGAFCCTECGCGGTSGACDPVCATGFMWDCEIGCCFNYSTFECDCPSGTSWDATMMCCKDEGGTCVVPGG